MALLSRLSEALRLALNSFPGSRPAKKELGQILDAAAVLVSGSGQVPINAITPDGGTLAITGDETVTGAITAGTSVNAGAAGGVHARLEKNGTASAIIYASYDINRSYQRELSASGIVETINAPTGQHTTALPANRADAHSVTDGTNDVYQIDTTTGQIAFIVKQSFSMGDVAGGPTSSRKIVFKKTGVADNTATDVLTVTVPNANHAACIKLTLLASTGGADAFESSRCAEGMVVLARTTGVNVVASVATLELPQIATVAGGATLTLAYDLSSIAGAVGATNTFTVRVTLNDSGNLGANQVVIVAEIINAEATGVTIAPA